MVNKALRIATIAHAGQLDKGGVPYITHPFRMALMLQGDDLRTVALLHDVVEDTSVTLKDLSDSFPTHIIEAVDAMTHRHGETYNKYLTRVNQNILAKQVKIADLRDNLSPDREYPNRRTERYESALNFLTNGII